MTLHIETGHPLTGDDAKWLEVGAVRFVTEDGRTMFEVKAGKDGRSLEIRAVDTTRVDGVLYAGLLDVRPIVANSIRVFVRRYDED